MHGICFKSSGETLFAAATGFLDEIYAYASTVFKRGFSNVSENARLWSLSAKSIFPLSSCSYSSSWFPYPISIFTSGYFAENKSMAL